MMISDFQKAVKQYSTLHPSVFWNSWKNEIDELICDLITAPPVIQNKNLVGDILYVYNEQFYRLNRRIGLQEFADLIGWSNRQLSAFRSKNNHFPIPVDHLAATPLWTVGQAEDFKRVLESRSIRGVRGDWTSTEKKEHWHIIQLKPMEDREEDIDENTVYKWNETGSNYYSGFRMSMSMLEVSFDDYERVFVYLMKRLSNPARLQYVLGATALKEANFQKAEEYLRESIKNFERVVPQSFEGRIDDRMEDYFYAYLYYSFILAYNGSLEEALEILHYVQSRLPEARDYIDFQDQIDLLEKSPAHFIAWFQELHFDDMPDPSAPCLPEGEEMSTPESRRMFWELAEKSNYKAIEFYYGNYERNLTSSLIQGPEERCMISIYQMGCEETSASLYTWSKGQILVLHRDNLPKRWFIVGLNNEDETKEWLDSLGITLSDELSNLDWIST
ncbi:hypothetical protein HQN89_27690 [Paenibacillus frigoriresistens]|uniref:tetratricopeptide repeat protein n=1 Tax=Paenibacillus alginolyticus TaxID=59839 RepID=UPI0015632B9B|nr:hypothetical protein [Paenibacillus frigoriresistens]NRF94685.1 hypothetical protein [Paenibacillus frigoriresistens]